MINEFSPLTFMPSSSKVLLTLAVLGTSALTTLAHANEFPAVIPLASVDGTIGVRLDGTNPYDISGLWVAGAGDVNGDGISDVLVGAPWADPGGRAQAGSSYVVFGRPQGVPTANLDLSSLDGSNGFRLDGVTAEDWSGLSVGGAGDVNGDGFSDLIIGAYHADPNARSGAGSSYVVFGKASRFKPVVKLSSLDGISGFRLNGVGAGDASGRSVAGAGDVNGDGFDDVLIGAPYAAGRKGKTYVVFGKAATFAPVVDLSDLDGTSGFRLDGVGGESGWVIKSAGDINHDGFADVIVGGAHAPSSDPGRSYVVLGKATNVAPFPSAIDLSTLDGKNGFHLDGVAPDDWSGWSVSGAGDVNGDSFDDLIVGARHADPNGVSMAGSSYVYFGKDPGSAGFAPVVKLSSLNGTNGFRLDGVAYYDHSGQSVSSAGDVNGDGFDDLVIGAVDARDFAGSTHVVFGKGAPFAPAISLGTLDGTDGFRLDGAVAGDVSGGLVADAGDFNDDGFADVIVGAHRTAANGPWSGSTYVIFGRAPDTPRVRNGAAASQYISGGQLNDVLKPKSGWDVVEGRGGADALIGGPGSDLASYAHAPSGVRASLASQASNTGDAAGDNYTEIEGLEGSRFADRLIGNGSANRIYGGLGRDTMTGGLGPDIFGFNTLRDSRPGAPRDIITDFEAGTAATSVDKINLREIDAVAGPGNQAFRFVGTAAFSSTAGEVRIERSGTSTIVMGDVNGDTTGDFEIELQNFTNTAAISALDFMR